MNTLRSRFPLLQLDRIRYNRYNVAICAEVSNPRTSLCRTVETGSRAGFRFRKQCFWALKLANFTRAESCSCRKAVRQVFGADKGHPVDFKGVQNSGEQQVGMKQLNVMADREV